MLIFNMHFLIYGFTFIDFHRDIHCNKSPEHICSGLHLKKGDSLSFIWPWNGTTPKHDYVA